MDSLQAYFLSQTYKKIHKLGDRLAKFEPLIDWIAFTSIIQPIYDNNILQGSRHNIDPVIMMKLLVLPQGYGLSDPELERQVNNRISTRHFLGFPEIIPIHSTVR